MVAAGRAGRGWGRRGGGAMLCVKIQNSHVKDGLRGRSGAACSGRVMKTVGTMTDNCIMPSEPASLSEPTV